MANTKWILTREGCLSLITAQQSVNVTSQSVKWINKVYNLNGILVYRMSNKISYSFPAPEEALYLLSRVYGADNKRFNKKIAL